MPMTAANGSNMKLFRKMKNVNENELMDFLRFIWFVCRCEADEWARPCIGTGWVGRYSIFYRWMQLSIPFSGSMLAICMRGVSSKCRFDFALFRFPTTHLLSASSSPSASLPIDLKLIRKSLPKSTRIQLKTSIPQAASNHRPSNNMPIRLSPHRQTSNKSRSNSKNR